MISVEKFDKKGGDFLKKFIVVTALLLAIPFSNGIETISASTPCSKYTGLSKVSWDGIELKPGQIGRLSVLQDTPIYTLEGEKKVFSRTLKAGEFFRIYAFKPGK
jgi:competence protein ComEC